MKVINKVVPRVEESKLHVKDQRWQRGHQIDENADRETFPQQVVPAPKRLGEIERQAAELEIVTDQEGARHGQDDHDHVALVPEEIAIGVAGAVELELLAQNANDADRLDWNGTELDRLLGGLRLGPGQQVLAEEEHEKDQQPQGVQSPEELAPKHHV